MTTAGRQRRIGTSIMDSDDSTNDLVSRLFDHTNIADHTRKHPARHFDGSVLSFDMDDPHTTLIEFADGDRGEDSVFLHREMIRDR